MKTAILQVADTGPLESLVEMLQSVGYHCFLPDPSLRRRLREIGCDTVVEIEGLVKNWGYDQPFPLPHLGTEGMKRCDLYVDVKAHRAYHKVVAEWPNLSGKVCWYRINGGEPEHVVNERGDMGDEVCPPCPVLTPDRWYRNTSEVLTAHLLPQAGDRTPPAAPVGSSVPLLDSHFSEKFYSFWPPFVRRGDYDFPRRAAQQGMEQGLGRTTYEPPVCLVHNLKGWHYADVAARLRNAVGLKCFGVGSPQGLVPHKETARLLAFALCSIHLKSVDAPGYALYESVFAGCPVVCPRRLIVRSRMQELFTEGETCLCFDRPLVGAPNASEEARHADIDVDDCVREITEAVVSLRDRAVNERFGEAARERLRGLMWSKDKPEDVASLGAFMGKHFQ